ncbi:hypothetical protein FRC18_001971 [Serendipita sp. 400]|nr:hypothetical protein FRC18_001971 [Serendipita sp. 400]
MRITFIATILASVALLTSAVPLPDYSDGAGELAGSVPAEVPPETQSHQEMPHSHKNHSWRERAKSFFFGQHGEDHPHRH